MLQKSKLTLCVSNPQATVWNSSGLESLRNFPQPYKRLPINNEEQISVSQESDPLASPHCPPVADKILRKPQQSTGSDGKTEPFPVVQKKISTPEHPIISPQRPRTVCLLMCHTLCKADGGEQVAALLCESSERLPFCRNKAQTLPLLTVISLQINSWKPPSQLCMAGPVGSRCSIGKRFTAAPCAAQLRENFLSFFSPQTAAAAAAVSYHNRNHSWRGSASASVCACSCNSLSEPRQDRWTDDPNILEERGEMKWGGGGTDSSS